MAFLAVPLAAQAIDYTVTTASGGGASNCSTTARAGSTVRVSSPWAIAADKQGNVYYADSSANFICKITSDGNVVRIGGNGTVGVGTDNVDATLSAVTTPYGLAADALGNVYVPEYYNLSSSVRKISTSGIITTIFNTSRSTTFGGDGGLATAATGNPPIGIAVAPTGEIYFSNYSGFRVRRIDNNGIITTYAGTGSSGYGGDGGLATAADIGYVSGIAVNSVGDLFLSSYTNCVRKIDATTKIITAYAGTCGSSGRTGDGGLATSALFPNLWGIAVDGGDNLYIAERGGQTIRRVDNQTKIVTTVVGINGSAGAVNGTTANATLNAPYGVAIAQNGDMYIADNSNNLIRKVAGIATPFTTTPLSISYGSGIKFNTVNSLSISGGSSGKITVYANGKRVPGCISRTYSGNFTCAWKPSQRGLIKVYAAVVGAGITTRTQEVVLNVFGRTTNR